MSIMAHKTLSAYKKPEIYLRTFKFCMHQLLKFDRRLVNLAFQFVTFIDYFQCVFSGGIFRTIWKAIYRFWAHGIWAPKIKAVKWKENLRTNMLSLLFKIRRKFRIFFRSHQKSIKYYNKVHPRNVSRRVTRRGSGGRSTLPFFKNWEKSALILGKNALTVVFYGLNFSF